MSIKAPNPTLDHEKGMLRRVKTVLTPRSLDDKIKHVSAVEDRIALEVAAYKQSLADIEWESKSGMTTFLRRKPSGSLGRIKLHVEAAMHKRAVEVLKAHTNDTAWKDRLRRDTIYRTLYSQRKWLHAILTHAKTVPNSSLRRQSADDIISPASPLRRMSLDECSGEPSLLSYYLVRDTDVSDDMPSDAYLAFESFLLTSHFDKAAIGVGFEKHCCDSLLTLSSTTTFQSLVTQVAQALSDEHDVSATNPELLCFVRQMVYSRVGAVFIAPVAAKLERDQVTLAQYTGQATALEHLVEVGLPSSTMALRRTMHAFEEMAFFMPDHIVHDLLTAVAILHDEVSATLACDSTSLSADVILPVLVVVVTHAKLSFLHSQVFAMEALALDNGQTGGEAAYYVALLQAAIAATATL
ncbi:hypothetical protein LEN26_015043 [Aphanomyces euteiches]|nr:hypothetical protein LEN26_015043 [Aphanomyces euteiches]KAH9192663.1 hypothetical protein AeNC1_005363 [Aphanomyces euteiches]